MSNLLHVLQGTARRASVPAAMPAAQDVTLELLDGTTATTDANAEPEPLHAARPESGRRHPPDAAPLAESRTAAYGRPQGDTPAPEATLAAVFAPAAATGGWQALLASDRGRRVALIALAVGIAAGLAVWSLRTPTDDSVLLVPPPGSDAAITAAATTPMDTATIRPPDASAPPPKAATKRAAPARRSRVRARSAAAPVDPGLAPADTNPMAGLPAALPAAPGTLSFTRTTPAPDLMQDLAAAHAAFVAGDYAAAESAWKAALSTRPGNLDATLGLAAVAARQGRLGEAETRYREVLRADPHNATAIAAMNLLPSATRNNPAAESALKVELAGQPAAAELHFVLGLRYVADGRWPEAQTEFFAAAEAAPANPDYAYNLAVTLDRLGKTGSAVSWYNRALALATGSQGFAAARVTARLATLTGTAAASATSGAPVAQGN